MGRVESHSSLSTFDRCPRRYHFRYVARVPAPSESIEAFLGKRVHEVMERLYAFVDRGMVPSLARVLRRFHQLFDDHFDAGRVRLVREGAELHDYRAQGERCLENAYRSLYPFDGDETLALERAVSFRLDPDGRYGMRGIIDRLVRARDGALEIHDYKTGRGLPGQGRLDSDPQLALYEIGIRDELGEKGEVRLVWHYLFHGARRVSVRTPESLAALREETRERIDAIRAESAWQARPGPLCRWCEYRELCPAQGGAGAPAAPPDFEPDEEEFTQLSLW
jgi:putative RecB family exonuclease